MKSRVYKKTKSHKKTKRPNKTKGGKKMYKKNKVKSSKHRGGRMSKFECRQKGCFRVCCPERGVKCSFGSTCANAGCHRRCP